MSLGFCALFPGAYRLHGNAQELSENSLADAEKFPSPLDLLGTVGLWLQLQLDRPTRKSFGNRFVVLQRCGKGPQSLSDLFTE